MNYRHRFHAGNFADVLKHAVLVAVLEKLKAKPAPFAVIDTHAGAGAYPMDDPGLLKSGEFQGGIELLAREQALPPLLEAYLGAVRRGGYPAAYPGSPLLSAQALREGDRLTACELHPKESEKLKKALGGHKNAHVVAGDGYSALKKALPPKERRGLVLVDPPYENPDEFARLMEQMAVWHRLWPSGIVLVWYPLKAHLATEKLLDTARALNFHRAYAAEHLIAPRSRAGYLNGCGLLMLNAPYGLAEALGESADAYGRIMGGALSVHLLTGA